MERLLRVILDESFEKDELWELKSRVGDYHCKLGRMVHKEDGSGWMNHNIHFSVPIGHLQKDGPAEVNFEVTDFR